MGNRRMMAICLLGSVSILPILILPTLVGALVDYLGFSEAQAGWLSAGGSLGGAVAALILAFRIHHLRLRTLGLAGLILMGSADFLSAWAAHIPFSVLMGLRALSSVGGACTYAAVMATIARTDEPERGYGLFMVLQFGISAVGLYGLPFLLPDIGASGLYVGMALMAALAIPLALGLPQVASRAEASDLEYRVLLRPAVMLVLLGIGLYEAANFMHYTYAERIGVAVPMDHESVGAVLGIATLVGVPGALGVVWLGDRWGSQTPILIALGASITGLTLLLFPAGPATYTVAMCLLGGAWAFGLPYFQALEAHLDPQGTVVVAGSFFTNIGAALGPALAALLVGEQEYLPVLVAAIALYAVVAILIRTAIRISPRV